MKQPKRRSGEGQGLGVVLRKQQSVELRHEAVIQGGELFEAVRAGLLQLLEEDYLMARIQLFEELPKLRHRIASFGHAQRIMHEALHKLLGQIVASEVSLGEFAGLEEFSKLGRPGWRMARARRVASRTLPPSGRWDLQDRPNLPKACVGVKPFSQNGW